MPAQEEAAWWRTRWALSTLLQFARSHDLWKDFDSSGECPSPALCDLCCARDCNSLGPCFQSLDLIPDAACKVPSAQALRTSLLDMLEAVIPMGLQVFGLDVNFARRFFRRLKGLQCRGLETTFQEQVIQMDWVAAEGDLVL